jgi:hypothetical protein
LQSFARGPRVIVPVDRFSSEWLGPIEGWPSAKEPQRKAGQNLVIGRSRAQIAEEEDSHIRAQLNSSPPSGYHRLGSLQHEQDAGSSRLRGIDGPASGLHVYEPGLETRLAGDVRPGRTGGLPAVGSAAAIQSMPARTHVVNDLCRKASHQIVVSLIICSGLRRDRWRARRILT